MLLANILAETLEVAYVDINLVLLVWIHGCWVG